ncbi:MAG TPA: CPBP family intramembrane glutamic endopeptidase [Candidatus Acidoferrum sp.]|nr:CPBP family intramembrane glutamic endopeptidase [Candidatus Acidoferrum sp.]
MSPFDDNPLNPPDQDLESRRSLEELPLTSSAEPLPAPLTGDAFLGAGLPSPPDANSFFPEDLRISWSWLHLLLFGIFGLISFFVVQFAFLIYYTPPNRHFANRHEFEQFVFSKPFFAIGIMVVWELSLILFLYVTIAVLPEAPFWRSLGWRKIVPRDPSQPSSPWRYLFSGCALSIGAFIVTAETKVPDNAPIEELFKHRSTMYLFMAMAVFFAPLVEETLFRGYLFPLLARFSSSLARSFGVESSAAARRGITAGIVLTGVLFGLVHGYQLGWSRAVVLTLTVVGIIFTYVRARTGSVYASYLLHLGYNSTIAVVTIIGFIGTKGFTRMPPGH